MMESGMGSSSIGDIASNDKKSGNFSADMEGSGDTEVSDSSVEDGNADKKISSFAKSKLFKNPKVKVIAGIAGIIIFLIFGFARIIAGSDENGSDPDGINNTTSSGTCAYDIKGFNTGNATIKKEMHVSNIKVRLMECDGSGPVENEELVDFEKYILGVTREEIGNSNDASTKAQAVAARSFSLARPIEMGNSGGLKLYEENGQWILQLRACTLDQAYCDPDRGCWSDGQGGEYGHTMHSGEDPTKKWSKGPIAADDKIRTLVKETEGEVMVDNNGYIVESGYKRGAQLKWIEYGKTMDYRQILLQYYNNDINAGVTDIIKVSCNYDSIPGDFASWKQCDPRWSNVPLGRSSLSVCDAGCLATSVAMLIAKSGVSTTISDFNPGTFVQTLNNNSGFDGALFKWNVTSVAPQITGFTYINASGKSREEKFNTIKSLVEQGYYVVAEVKGGIGGTHWVAIDHISGNDIIMMDPSSHSKTNILWNEYKWERMSVIRYFKV